MATKLNLGNEVFNKKVTKYYAWIIPAIYVGMTILFLITNSWIPALLMLLIVVLTLPPLDKYFKKIRIGSMSKFMIGAVLTIAAFYSTGLYL